MRLFRFGTLGTSLHGFDKLPASVRQENVWLRAGDGGESQGVLYTRGGEHSVVHFMHPRGDQSRHYAMPALLEAGFAVFGQAGRYLFNDSEFIYEHSLADVAAANVFLRSRGYGNVLAFGNSGGGTLFSFYQAQASTPPNERLTHTPAGDPCALRSLDMPTVDALLHVATHLGQGKLMSDYIDPSVVDESCPFSCDPELDMFDMRNGFQVPPAQSRYSSEFLLRYRQAQLERVKRIDAAARAKLAEQAAFARILSDASLSVRERLCAERRAVADQYFQVHRTQANPALLDLSIAPNKRELGSFYSARPDIANYTLAGFGKWQTPRAWLSTWSYFSSRAATLACLPKNTVPTLVMVFSGDNMIMPGELETLFERSPAHDKTLLYVDADHFGHGLPGQLGPGGRTEVCSQVVSWLQQRFS
jgi:hypothetical protein